jgi:hypothetical protein
MKYATYTIDSSVSSTILISHYFFKPKECGEKLVLPNSHFVYSNVYSEF